MSCIACDLASGRAHLPGGRLHRTPHWVVEHCIGPLGLGTLVVKPLRHVTSVAELDDAEAAELGPLLRLAARVAGSLVGAEQVYTCLWSHAGAVPGHVHYVVQPVTSQQVVETGLYGRRCTSPIANCTRREATPVGWFAHSLPFPAAPADRSTTSPPASTRATGGWTPPRCTASVPPWRSILHDLRHRPDVPWRRSAALVRAS